GSEDVALLAVDVVQQRDARVAIGVVLDGGDLRRHAVLVATEVDDAVLALVRAAAVASRLAPVRVAAAALRVGLRERLLGLARREVGEVGARLEAASRAGRLALANRHRRQLPKMSIVPSRRVTIARLVSGFLPTAPRTLRERTSLPWRLRVLTLATFTSG